MAQADLKVASANCWQLVGGLRFDTVTAIERQIESELNQVSDALEVDLSAVEHSDSSAIALMISIWRSAQKRNISVNFTQIPEQLRTIAQLSSLDQVLPLA